MTDQIQEPRALVVAPNRTPAPAAALAHRTLKAITTAASVVPTPGLLVVCSDGSGTFQRIRDAVVASGPRDTIFVKPGVYSEPGLTLHGRRVLRGSGTDETEIVLSQPLRIAGTAHIEDIGLQEFCRDDGAGGPEPIDDDALVIVDGGSPVLTSLRIDTFDRMAIHVTGGSDPRFSNCDVGMAAGLTEIDSESRGLFKDCELGDLWVRASSPQFTGSTIFGESIVGSGATPLFESCELGGLNRAVGLEVRDPETAPTIRSCEIFGGWRGAAFWNGARGRVVDTLIVAAWSRGKLVAWLAKQHPDSEAAETMAKFDYRARLYGMPERHVPARYRGAEWDNVALKVQDHGTAPSIERCHLQAEVPLDVDDVSRPTVTDCTESSEPHSRGTFWQQNAEELTPQ